MFTVWDSGFRVQGWMFQISGFEVKSSRWEDTNQSSIVSRVEGGRVCLQAERNGLFKWVISDPTTFGRKKGA